jgi:hypothetical protein
MATTCNLTTEISTDLGCFPNDPVGFVQKFYGVGLGFVGAISLLMLIYGGYSFIVSRGNPSQVSIAKSYMFYAITGLLLAIFGYVFIQVIMVDIFKVPGFK